jgi:hypothetical protein
MGERGHARIKQDFSPLAMAALSAPSNFEFAPLSREREKGLDARRA